MENLEDLQNKFRLYAPSRQIDPEDTELAFQLQNATSVDPDLLEKMVYLYAASLYRWVDVLLFYRKMVVPSHEEILDTLRIIFERSISHIDQFHGKASVSDWLFDVSLLVVGGYSARNRIADLRKIISGHDNDSISREPASDHWKNIDCLPEKLRWPLILRYLFDLDLPDIADILHIQVSDIHSRLNRTRQQLILKPNQSHYDRQILAFMDGVLDENPDELNQLLQHLAECDLCQAYAINLNGLEKNLSALAKERWRIPALSNDETNALIQSLLSEKQQPKLWWREKLPVKQSMWILGLCAIFVGLAIIFVRMTPEEREFPQAKATASPTLPPIIERPPGAPLLPNHGIVPNPPQYIVPNFSSDGNWAVFAVIHRNPGSWMSLPPSIELYNRETNSIKTISESTPGINFPRAFWDLVPSISADGEWIAYASVSDDRRMPGSPCTTSIQFTCVDIFLYDRETGQTRLITQNAAGALANGDSFAPTVSADGQWVAFWSAASNLVDGTQGNCEIEQNISCLYVYLYSQASGKIEQIPLRTFTSVYSIGADRISLSADGRFIAFTVTKEKLAQLQQQVQQVVIPSPQNSQETIEPTPAFEFLNNSEAIVYDRQTGKYEMVNQTQDGSPGNGDSYSPVLSADGKFVAFSSASSNLVPGDSNGFADIFIRDRTDGTIELISHAPDGSPGNGQSGLMVWSGYGLSISSDGRYIIYVTEATNLSKKAPVECNPTGLVCNLLYLYDRQAGTSELINDPQTYDFSYFPQISSDGRWASFMHSESRCPLHLYQCADVMLYDRQKAWTTNLTKSAKGIGETPWSYLGNLPIPKEILQRNALAFSPDGSYLALAGNDYFVRIWHISAGMYLYNQGYSSQVLGGGEPVSYTSLTFSPDGKLLAAGTTTRKVYVWKIPDGNLLYTLEADSGPIKDIKFSADGNQLVVSGNTQTEIWQIEINQLIRVKAFSFGQASIYDVAISPTGNVVASALGDGTVWLQSIPSGQVVGRLGGEQLAIRKIIFSLDGNLLATYSMNRTINIWQINGVGPGLPQISLLNTFQTDNKFGLISFSPDGRYLTTSPLDGGILFWDVYNGDIYTAAPSNADGRLETLAFSGRGDKLAGTLVNGDLAIWGLTPGSSSTFFAHALRDDYGDSGPMPLATANDILMLREPTGRSMNEHLTLDQAAADLSFPLLVPAHLPSNITFRNASVNIDGSAWLEYDASETGGIQAGLYIYEQPIGNAQPPTMTVGASAAVIQVPIVTAAGMDIADYVQGDWSWSRYYNSQDNTHNDIWVWNSMRPTQRLRWTQQGIFIALYYQVTIPYERVENQPAQNEFVPLDNLLTQQDLVQIAQGMLPFLEENGLTSNDTSNQMSTDTSLHNTLVNHGEIYLLNP